MPAEENRCLRDIGEDELITRLTAGLRMDKTVRCGPGDDCAVLFSAQSGWLDLFKTDTVVEGIHFVSDADPEAVGWKALARPTSDIAAMGGLPTAAVVTIVAPGSLELATAEGWYRGLQKAAEAFGISVVGGETSSTGSKAAVISVAMTGRVEESRCVYRSGAQIGDAILVTGRLGGSLQSLRHLNFQPRLNEARWLTKNFQLHAMMDLSDGLAKDLPRMMKLSQRAYRVDRTSLPCHQGCSPEAAMTDGEDYELLFTLGADKLEQLMDAWEKEYGAELKLSRIGEVCEHSETEISGGWDHFGKAQK